MTESFPRLSARTRRFSLGVPRDITIAPDGARVVFLRTRSGVDPVTCLWELDVATGAERLVVDPRTLDLAADQTLPTEERARRERARESADGIVAYAPDTALTRVAFALAGSLWIADLAPDSDARRLDTPGGIIDPSLSPDGRHAAYVADGAFHVQEIATGHRHHPRRARRTRRDLGPRRVHRGGGDGPDAWPLVVARRRDHPRATHR